MKRARKSATVVALEPTTNIQRERQRRALNALALKRRNPKISMTEAAKRSGTTLQTVRRYAGAALEVRSGRYDAKSTDRIARALQILTPDGLESVVVRNSRDATRIAKHHNAVRRAILSFGQDSAQLNRFAGKSLKAGGKTYHFATDYAKINRLARAGAINFLDIYDSAGTV